MLSANQGKPYPATKVRFNRPNVDLGDIKIIKDTTIGELPTSEFRVSADTVTSNIDRTLRKKPDLPGVIVYDKHGVLGAISRRKFYEMLGKRYGVAVFLKRPVQYMIRSMMMEIPVLSASNKIAESVRFALDRPSEQIYEPILIEFSSRNYRLLDIYTLLLAQSRLFATLQIELKMINEELEQRVAKRTSELVRSNTQLQQEVLDRERAEGKLQKRLKYEEALTKCASVLLTGGDAKGVNLQILQYLLEAAGVSHVFLGDLVDFDFGGPGIKLIHRVNVPGVPSIPSYMTVFLLDSLKKWSDSLWSGTPVVGQQILSQKREKILLQELGFSTALLLPVGEPGNWVGVLGFGEHRSPRGWQHFEIQLLQTVSHMIYAYKERRQNALELAQARDEALQANRFKGEILAKVSHELRTPLTAIMGFSQMLSYGSYGQLSKEQTKPIDMIISSSKYLSILVNGILDQAQLETGQLVLLQTPFNLRTTLEEVEARMRVLAEAKGLDFTVKIDSDIPGELVGDRTRIQQVLINLLGNAIKFTEKGKIQLKVCVVDHETIQFRIRDTGPGIPKNTQKIIFQPFTQVDGSPTRRFSGTGLGLSISHQLVQKMNGKITLESKKGSGSTFIVHIPINYG